MGKAGFSYSNEYDQSHDGIVVASTPKRRRSRGRVRAELESGGDSTGNLSPIRGPLSDGEI